MLTKMMAYYYLDKYEIHYNIEKKQYTILLKDSSLNLSEEFKNYFGKELFKVNSKKEVINNLYNFSQYYQLDFNPKFKHHKTIYKDTAQDITVTKFGKQWMAYKKQATLETLVYNGKTRKEVISKCLNKI